MSQSLLVKIITCLCLQNGALTTHDDRLECSERYVNCAIVKDGQFLSVKDFDKRCNFQPKQERCYGED